jgi:hypothetical protein
VHTFWLWRMLGPLRILEGAATPHAPDPRSLGSSTPPSQMRYSSRILLPTLLLLWASCRYEPPQPPARSVAPTCPSTTPYIVLSGPDTIAVSWVSVTDSTVESQDRAVSQGALLRFRGRRSLSGALEQMQVRIWHSIADSAGAPTQQALLDFRPTEVVAVVSAPGRGSTEVQVQHDPVRPGTMPYMANSPLFLELLQRHASHALTDSVRVPVLWLFTGGATDDVVLLRPAADSVIVRLPAFEYRLGRTQDGTIAGATGRSLEDSTADQMQIVRPGCR